jgi:uncharacterized protein YcaQ
MKALTLTTLRRHAIARSLFPPTTLPRAIARLGFVQADPIRAPARAQDLVLRHRVAGYHAGDLERRYASLAIEEDIFINYGFLPRETAQLMHPRAPGARWSKGWSKARQTQAEAVLEFVRAHGTVHPRDVDAHFDHGTAKNWFGGNTNASTQLLDAMHYRGLVRIASREGGVRIYAPREPHAPVLEPAAAFDALIDVAVGKYAPVPERSLSGLVSRVPAGAPQFAGQTRAAFVRAKARLASRKVDGVTWYWPADERPERATDDDGRVRLLAPFDPVVWDRLRFELFWGWAYRFEAYTPAAKRVRGYYALPLLWRDEVIGWGNLAVRDGALVSELGYVSGQPPKARAFHAGLAEELAAMKQFLLGE